MERAKRRGRHSTRARKYGTRKIEYITRHCDGPLKLIEGKPCHTSIIKKNVNAFALGNEIEDQVHKEQIDAFCLMGIKRAIPVVFKIARRFAYAHNDWWFRVNYYNDVPPELGPPGTEIWVAIVITIGEIPDADSATTFINSMYMQDGTKTISNKTKETEDKKIKKGRDSSTAKKTIEVNEDKHKEEVKHKEVNIKSLEETEAHSVEGEDETQISNATENQTTSQDTTQLKPIT